jgi:anti-sigma regulatory factor (Ser/Thr protein kinase)
MLIEIKYPLHLKFVKQICQTTSDIAKTALNNSVEHTQNSKFLQEIELMTGEACTNSFRHAADLNQGELILRLVIKESHFEIIVMDQNPEFDFNNTGQPEFDKIPESGYGIHIIKSLADKVVYTRAHGWNKIHITKRLPH